MKSVSSPAPRNHWVALLVGAHVLAAATVSAQPAPSAVSVAPTSPVSRDATGRVVIRATRILQPLKIDGRLDEAAYSEVPPITEFIQQVPNNGAPVSERTEMWVLFDDDNIYLSCRCWDEHPDQIVADDMRRDSSSITNQDGITIGLDTFNDQRSGFMFTLTPAGALRDGTTTEERANFDWNTVFDGRATRSDRGWIGEMVIPFKSLRYKPGREQIWGVHLRRVIRGKNEADYITKVNPVWGSRGLQHYAEGATLVGIEAPPASRNLELKPYALSQLTTDRTSRPIVNNAFDPNAGFDVKYGLNAGLTADFTYNTDFAQVEADEAQVNLTRFSIMFAEKREFFLEGADIFNFGRSGAIDLGGDAPTIFYSRRIGLSGSRVVPVVAGGRLTGKTGPWTVGALNIRTEADDASRTKATNFSVVRVKRDVARLGTIGALFTGRSASVVAPGSNEVWGTDAAFNFARNIFVSGYAAQSRTEGAGDDTLSYRAQFNYMADRYGLALDRIVVGQNFNPEIGFVRRADFRRNLIQARFSPRTTNNHVVRQWTYEGSLDYITDNNNRLESRNLTGTFRTDFQNSDAVTLDYSRLFEFLPKPFTIAPGVRLPVRGYAFDNVRLEYLAGTQHRISGTSALEVGSFYDGSKTTATFRGRAKITMRLGIEPNVSLNWVDLPEGRFTNTVVGGRTVYTVTPRMFVAALIQYSSSSASLTSNLRFRWEYLPGSEIFVVYTEGRTTLPPRGAPLESRGVVVKVNRLLRF